MTVNVVLLAIVCMMVGYSFGKYVGRESTKKAVEALLKDVTNGLRAIREAQEEKEK